MAAPKNILIMVLAGAKNLGDEMILRAEYDFFRDTYPTSKISVATFDTSSTFGEDEIVSYISYFPNGIRKNPIKNIFYFLRQTWAMLSHELIVIGGGGIFFDNEKNASFDKILWEWRMRIFFARLMRRKIVFCNISIEVKKEENLLKLCKIFSPSDTILVRDAGSHDRLASVGIESQISFDSVFLQPPQELPERHEVRTIGIALRSGFWGNSSEKALNTIITTLAQRGFQIVFLSHSLHPNENNNDAHYIRHLFGDQYPITETMEETLHWYKDIDMMIGMRLHSIILAAQYAIPILPISYSPKTDAIIEMLGLSEYRIDSATLSEEDFFQVFDLQINNYTKEQYRISQNYQQIHTMCLQKIQKTAIFEG